MEIVDRFVAVDDKCAWPNLTLMPDGAIVASIFGEPTHGGWEGDAECWASRDGGQTWKLFGVPAPHEPTTNRMNLAAGLTPGGAFVVLCSGWSLRPPRGEYRPPHDGKVLLPWVCRSEDGGKTWTHEEGVDVPPQLAYAIPFGDIVPLGDGRLAVACYSRHAEDRDLISSWVFFSQDDGRTWGDARPIGQNRYTETTLLSLGGGKLLAAARTRNPQVLEVFASDDSGQTWTSRGPASLTNQIPAHMCLLEDGAVLLTYGVRNEGMLGVCARLSRDAGETWDAPRVLFATERTDGGYPASVQLPDGLIVTAYYCKSITMHQRYHMGVVRWRLE